MQHRRKTENLGIQGRRGGNWLSSRPSYRGDGGLDDDSAPSNKQEEVSYTQTESTVSSRTTSNTNTPNGVEGFEMPNWEQPNWEKPTDVGLSSTKKLRIKPNKTPTGTAAAQPKQPVSPQTNLLERDTSTRRNGTSNRGQISSLQSDEPTEPQSPPRSPRSRPARQEDEYEHAEEQKEPEQDDEDRRGSLENMVVTLDGSLTSLADDITFLDGESLAGGNGTVADFTYSGSRPGAHRVTETNTRRSQSSNNNNNMSGEQIKEEEMIRLAMERSMQDVGAESPSDRHREEPRGGRRDSVSTRGMEEEIANSPTTEGSAKFVWKKGPNGRYRRVPVGSGSAGGGGGGLDQINENERYGNSAHNSRSSSSRDSEDERPRSLSRDSSERRPRSDESVTRMEEDMLREAMERSRIDAESTPSRPQPTKAEIEQEQALLEVAMQRSMQESGLREQSSDTDHRGHGGQYNPPQSGHRDRDYHHSPPRHNEPHRRDMYHREDPHYHEHHYPRGRDPRNSSRDKDPRDRDPRDRHGDYSRGQDPRYSEYQRDPSDGYPRDSRGGRGYEDYHQDPRMGGRDRYYERESFGYDDPPPRRRSEEPQYDPPHDTPQRRSYRRSSLGGSSDAPRHHHHDHMENEYHGNQGQHIVHIDHMSALEEDRMRYRSSRSMGMSRSSLHSTTSRGSQRIGFLHQPDTGADPGPPTRSYSGDSSASGKNFEWRRGPNGRFIKVPIGGDDYDEFADDTGAVVVGSGNCRGAVRETEQERLARVEREMMEEAMERSMQDFNPGGSYRGGY